MPQKKSLFQKLKKSLQFDDEFFDEEDVLENVSKTNPQSSYLKKIEYTDSDEKDSFQNTEEVCGELSVDVYELDQHVMIQAMIAGVKPESLEVIIGRDNVTIRGKREDMRKINDDQFFIRELYWGAFARTIALSQEIDPDLAEASEKYGLLTLKLPKIDKNKRATIKVKSI